MSNSDRDGLIYRMPYGFGPTSGPRQGPDGKPFDWSTTPHCWTAAVSFLTAADCLKRILPPQFELVGEPIVTVDFQILTELEWLAGRGYSLMTVRFPAAFRGRQDLVVGNFLPVLWENLADPILSGREELGMAKLWCDLPPPVILPDRIVCKASWLSHEFITLELDRLAEVEKNLPAYPGLGDRRSDGTLHYKYIPRTGEWGREDVAYACLTPPARKPTVERLRRGRGRVRFHPTSWEQMPTQFHIIATLAALPMLEARDAWCVETRGGSDLSAQRALY